MMPINHSYEESRFVKDHCGFCGEPKVFHFNGLTQPPSEMTSLREIKSRLAAIEQGLDKLLQGQAALESELKKMFQNIHDRIELYSGFPEAFKGIKERLDRNDEPVVIQGIKEFVDAYNSTGPKEVIEQAKAFKGNGKPKPRRKRG